LSNSEFITESEPRLRILIPMVVAAGFCSPAPRRRSGIQWPSP